ncbi:uncharacterized protein LOC111334864 [Stylophora pistillata]|uniref:uncharacterized protein LOC111334864 n=1 Tax=Stylophora pistillata TaxID=50429 RepID=UPI000C04292F|nr:uncharacterized protein LOC111334864 [Stylophora pistillata]
MVRNVFVLVSFTILCLEGTYFFTMPGGESSEGDGSSASTSSGVSTPVAVEVGSLQPFQVKGDPHSVSQRWRKWKRAFQLYALGKGITNDSQKCGLLLHTAGLDVQEVYFTLVPDGAEKNYAETFKVLDDYFIPKANVPFERHLFRQISQSNEETVDQFVCRLRLRAASCEFGEREDEYIRDQLIDKCYSAKLRRKFLEKEGSVTLNDLLVTARAQEAVNLQMEAMGANSGSGQVNTVVDDGARGGDISSEQVNSVVNLKGSTSSEKRGCFNCGREDHLARDWRCPARGRKCLQCGEIGHFKVKCCKKLAKYSHLGQRQGDCRRDWRNTSSVNERGRKTNTNYVDSSPKSGQDSKPNYVFSVGDGLDQKSGIVTFVVGGAHLPNILDDSGATCNLLGQGTWEWLKSQKIQCQTRKEPKALYP